MASGQEHQHDDHAPASTAEYLSKDYWDRRFAVEEHYEWCRGYSDFCHLTRPHMLRTDAILLIGSGNSALTEQLFEDGFTNITSVDISPVAIERLKRKLENQGCTGLKWAVADMLELGSVFDKASFDVVIEKGTLDVLFVDSTSPWRLSNAVADRVERTLRGVHTVLRPGGVFISITFAQPHFRKPLMEAPPLDWTVQVDAFGDDWKYFVYAARRPATVELLPSVSNTAAPKHASCDAEAAVLRGLGYDPERFRSTLSSTEHEHMDNDDYLLCINV